MDMRQFYPVQGQQIVDLVGGPYDNLGLYFDELPQTLTLDGHVYELKDKSFLGFADYSFIYRGKAADELKFYDDDGGVWEPAPEAERLFFMFVLLEAALLVLAVWWFLS